VKMDKKKVGVIESCSVGCEGDDCSFILIRGVGCGFEWTKPWNEFSEVVKILETGEKIALIESCVPSLGVKKMI
jgi:hypothetical protein